MTPDYQSLPPWIDRWLQRLENDTENDAPLRAFLPLMGSVDVRHDEADRVCAIDPNRYPQGFNNVEPAADFVRGREFLCERLRQMSAGGQKIHVVEEDYPDKHPYFAHLEALKQFLSQDGRPVSVSSGREPVAVSGELQGGPPTSDVNVLNVLNTSYPSDLRAIFRAGGVKTAIVADTTDPELYNSYRKRELYSYIHGWLEDLVKLSRAEAAADDIRAPELELIHETTELEARFDFVDGVVAVERYDEPSAAARLAPSKRLLRPHGLLASLIGQKLRPGCTSTQTAWRKVFVKDDNGCNGVGLCVFGERDLIKPEKNNRDHGSCSKDATTRAGSAVCRITNAHRRLLRGRDKGTASTVGTRVVRDWAGEKEKQTAASGCEYVLQEGIPTALRNSKTNSQLELVVMCIDGRVWSYFARELVPQVGDTGSCREQFLGSTSTVTTTASYDGIRDASATTTETDSSGTSRSSTSGCSAAASEPLGAKLETETESELDEAPQASKMSPHDGGSLVFDHAGYGETRCSDDRCVSLNVAGVNFVCRREFEQSLEYREAFDRVRRCWWKYELVARLSMLAMARQKRKWWLAEKAAGRQAVSVSTAPCVWGQMVSVGCGRVIIPGLGPVFRAGTASQCKTVERASQFKTVELAATRGAELDHVSALPAPGRAETETATEPGQRTSATGKVGQPAIGSETQQAFARRISGQLMRELNACGLQRSVEAKEAVKKIQKTLASSAEGPAMRSEMEALVGAFVKEQSMTVQSLEKLLGDL